MPFIITIRKPLAPPPRNPFDRFWDNIYEHYKHTSSFLLNLALIFGVVFSLVTGIHSGVLAKYEDTNFDNRVAYNWYSPKDLIRFACDQISYGIKDRTRELNEPYNSNTDTLVFTFIVDRTRSVSATPGQEGMLKKMIFSNTKIPRYKFANFTLPDLVCFRMIDFLNDKFKQNKKIVRVYFMEGLPDATLEVLSGGQDSFEGYDLNGRRDIDTIFSDYKAYLDEKYNNSGNLSQQTTDFGQVFTKLDQELNGSLNDKVNIVTFISDFLHENSYENIDNSLKNAKLSKSNLQMNLLRLTTLAQGIVPVFHIQSGCLRANLPSIFFCTNWT